jgi:hypothetical protein
VTVMIMVINYCPFCDGDDNDDKLLHTGKLQAECLMY